MTDREAAAGLVERLRADAIEISGWGAGNEAGRVRQAATLITTLFSELESAETRATNAEAARNMLAAKRDAAEARALKAEKERDEALERAHYADGTAELAMKHRDAAEALVAEAVRVCEPFEHEADEYPLKPDNERPEGIVWFDFGDLRAARAFIEKAKS